MAQNPFLSLSPRLTIAQILSEPLLARGDAPGADMRARQAALLSRCGLPPDFLPRRASELSGGQAQRVAIARALALNPRLLVLDEPTSALDVSVQAQILNLLMDLKADFGLSMVFVTHNLKVVAHVSDQLLVMQQGKVDRDRPDREGHVRPRADLYPGADGIWAAVTGHTPAGLRIGKMWIAAVSVKSVPRRCRDEVLAKAGRNNDIRQQ